MTTSKIRIARVAKGFSQTRLAKRVRCSQSLVCQIERHEYEPDARLRGRISKALGMPEDVLFGTGLDDEGKG